MRHDMEDMMHGSTPVNLGAATVDALPGARVRTFGKRRKRGFTLLEMTIVVAILGVISAIAIPNFLGLQNSAVRVTAEGTASALSTAFAVNYAAAYSGSPDATTFAAGSTITADDLAGIVTADLTDYTLVCPVLLEAGTPTTCTLGYDGVGFVPPVYFYAVATE